MRIKIGKYVLFFGKAKMPENNPRLMEKPIENSVEVPVAPKLSRKDSIRKWQLEHKDDINARRKELYNIRKTKGVCVKCGHKQVGRPALHKDGRPFLLCLKCRMQGKTPSTEKRGRGRPKGSKNKRKPGRPKGC